MASEELNDAILAQADLAQSIGQRGSRAKLPHANGNAGPDLVERAYRVGTGKFQPFSSASEFRFHAVGL